MLLWSAVALICAIVAVNAFAQAGITYAIVTDSTGKLVFAANTTSSYPEPLVHKNPLGSLIYDPSISGTIASAGDTATFTLPVDGSQTITLDVKPSAGSLQASVTVQDPNGSTIASATAAAAGKEVVVQTVPASTTGTYKFVVSGANSTTGSFTIQAILNAALDAAAHGGPENTTRATAQDIDPSAIVLTASTNRMGVLGHFDGTADFYSFALNVGQSATIALTLSSSASVTLQLEDGAGTVLDTGVSGAQDVTLSISNFVAPATGTYYVGVGGSGTSDYSLVVTRGADFELESNDDAFDAQALNSSGVVLGAIGNGAGMPDTDWYSFNVTAHQTITLSTTTPSDQGEEFHNTLVPQLDLYDNNMEHVATNSGGSKNAPVVWTALTTGRYFVQVTGASNSTGEYVLSETLSQAPDVTITKTALPDPVLTGHNVTYTLTVTNVGGAAASTVAVTDDLPGTTLFVSCSAPGGTCGGSGSHRTVTYASLASTASATITLVAVVNCPVADGTKIKNTATVTAAVDANPNNNSASATVTASNPEPVVSDISVDAPVLWPPNHKMVDVTVNYTVADNCGVDNCVLTVSSNEPPSDVPEWQVVDAHHVLLRAERDGNGSGRVYTITITCTDSAGSATVKTVTVTVPHDQGKN
jgi:uncharacterized repeat protein (TIGR01451 family)